MDTAALGAPLLRLLRLPLLLLAATSSFSVDAFVAAPLLTAAARHRGVAVAAARPPHMMMSNSTRTKMDTETEEESLDDDFSSDTSPDNGGDGRDGNPLRPLGEAIDSVVSSPWLAPLLFWAPFAANPSLRAKASAFLPQLTESMNPAVVVGMSGAGLCACAYKVREGTVREASLERGRALRRLREDRARRLSSSSSKSSDDGADANGGGDNAELAYELALRRELDLRSLVLAGLRVRMTSVPADPADPDSEDNVAARQFLGLRVTEDGELV